MPQAHGKGGVCTLPPIQHGGIQMNAKEMWERFAAQADVRDADYEAWAFGGAPDELADLVCRGIKTATSSACALYKLEQEPLPSAGAYSVILDSNKEAKCVIRTIKVSVVPFCQISEDHAYQEGEGDRSLAHWRAVHEAFFRACLSEAGLPFDENAEVVCEEFAVVYP